MPGARAKKIAGRNFTREAHTWKRWMTAAAQLAQEFGAVEDDPFSYNEAATVSLLTAAAVKADMLALAEFASTKRHPITREISVNGRCDLWICSDRTSWAFEFKQIHYDGGYHWPKTIMGWLNQACDDARRLTFHEADKRFGALVISLYRADHIDPDFLDSIARILNRVDYAWQLSPRSGFAEDTILLFKEVHKRRARKKTLTKEKGKPNGEARL